MLVILSTQQIERTCRHIRTMNSRAHSLHAWSAVCPPVEARVLSSCLVDCFLVGAGSGVVGERRKACPYFSTAFVPGTLFTGDS